MIEYLVLMGWPVYTEIDTLIEYIELLLEEIKVRRSEKVEFRYISNTSTNF